MKRKKTVGGVDFVITNDVRLSDLEAKRDEFKAQAAALIQAADDEERDLTDAEIKNANDLATKIKAANAQIEARALLSEPAGRKTSNAVVKTGDRKQTVAAEVRANEDPKHGFRSFGEFAMQVHAAIARGDENAVKRFQNVATTYGSEQNGPDGGFAVPPDFQTEIWKKVTGVDSLMSRATNFQVAGNSLTIPKDETTPWDTTTGIQAYWIGEGDVMTQSRPSLETSSFRLNKLAALVPVSDELLEDAPGLESYLRTKTPEKMLAKINTAMYRGNGVGKPLGMLSAASTLTISKEVSQDAGTLTHTNIEKMYARMWAPSRQRAVWMINQDLEPQLGLMAFKSNKEAFPVPVYLPGGSLANQPYALLKGLPVIPIEAASTAGEFGDIALVDWSQYMTVTKGEQIKTDVSIHLFFDQGLQAFRFTFRMTGAPLWGGTIVPENGSMTRSWAVAIETRG